MHSQPQHLHTGNGNGGDEGCGVFVPFYISSLSVSFFSFESLISQSAVFFFFFHLIYNSLIIPSAFFLGGIFFCYLLPTNGFHISHSLISFFLIFCFGDRSVTESRRGLLGDGTYIKPIKWFGSDGEKRREDKGIYC